ncbi:hypothetical protein QBC39DRAFT_436478 [Podospora conica]|nr:hypothetical protein QBC39DRAFT_436478 [Schizothecium conicum]
MQSTTTPTSNVAFFSSFFSGSSSNFAASSSHAKSRPGTSSGEAGGAPPSIIDASPSRLQKDRDRKPSFGRKSSFSTSSPSKSLTKRRTSSYGANGGVAAFNAVPPLPDLNIAAAAKLSRDTETLQSPASIDSFSKMMSRTAPTPVNGYPSAAPGQLGPPANVVSGMGQPQSELGVLHQNIQDTANKRISTLEYLRKAHEGRVYWFNTLLFDKPDLARMPYFDNRKLARRATNYLLLGISLPTVIDLNSNNATDFLRSLLTLLAEFENFQALHSESGAPNSLSRARFPQMFRRTGPSLAKGRRSSSATSGEFGGPDVHENGGLGPGLGGAAMTASVLSLATSNGSASTGGGSGGAAPPTSVPPASVINFAASETDLLPGEEYSHLLTPSLPFDPDFFETFATLCDVLIDTYTRLLSLMPTPRECGGAVAELFSKVDSRVRKIIISGVIKEFEDSSRAGVRAEVANVGRVVLGGLM